MARKVRDKARIIASGLRSLRIFPLLRWEMNGSTMAISWRAASSLTAVLQASSVRAVAGSSGSIRISILPPSKPAVAMLAAS